MTQLGAVNYGESIQFVGNKIKLAPLPLNGLVFGSRFVQMGAGTVPHGIQDHLLETALARQIPKPDREVPVGIFIRWGFGLLRLQFPADNGNALRGESEHIFG